MTPLVDNTSYVLSRSRHGSTLHTLKRAAEAERLSESSNQWSPSRNETFRWQNRTCDDGAFGIATLHGRIRPGAAEGAQPGCQHTAFSNRPNRGWIGKHGNGGRKSRTSGCRGKPSARRTPSALPADSK